MRLLRPSAASLRTVAPPLGHAFTIGAINLRRATSLNNELAAMAQALRGFGSNPVVSLGLEDFAQTLEYAQPAIAGLAGEQVFCNYVTLAFRNVASVTSENAGDGYFGRASLVLSPSGPNNEGYPSSAPANGPSIEKAFVGSNVIVDNNHVHSNPYPNVGGPGQPRVCEAANEGYEKGKAVVGNLAAGSVAPNREFTTREQNLFGERYPAATLADLGLIKASAPTHKRRAAKGKRK
jgi:hypothetical protein